VSTYRACPQDDGEEFAIKKLTKKKLYPGEVRHDPLHARSRRVWSRKLPSEPMVVLVRLFDIVLRAILPQVKDLMREVEVLKTINHPNVIK
jgi:serine/threonine protein kinase